MPKKRAFISFFKKIFSSRSKQVLFIMMAIILFAIASVIVVYNFIFLVANLTKALSLDVKTEPSLEFDIKGFEKLNLIKP